MSMELHVVIHFLWPRHTSDQAILSELEEVNGTNAIWLRALEKWITAFDGRRTEFADLPRPGRPFDTENVDALGALIEGEGYVSEKKVTQMLGIHHETVKRILRDDLNKRKMNFK
jgi:hypothetical protein